MAQQDKFAVAVLSLVNNANDQNLAEAAIFNSLNLSKGSSNVLTDDSLEKLMQLGYSGCVKLQILFAKVFVCLFV